MGAMPTLPFTVTPEPSLFTIRSTGRLSMSNLVAYYWTPPAAVPTITNPLPCSFPFTSSSTLSGEVELNLPPFIMNSAPPPLAIS